jgi:hypothetical protein
MAAAAPAKTSKSSLEDGMGLPFAHVRGMIVPERSGKYLGFPITAEP